MSFSQFVADEEEWANGIERQERDRARATAIAGGMSEDDVRHLTQIAASYPWLRPGVALAASQAGLDDRSVAGIAGHVAAAATADPDGWRAVGTKVPAIPQVYSPRVMTQLENAETDANFGLGPPMRAGVDEAFPEQEERGGVLGFLGDAWDVGVQAFELANPTAKGSVRYGIAAVDAPTQHLVQSFRSMYQDQQQGAGFFDHFDPRKDFETLANPGSNLGVGLATGDWNMGSGWTPGGTNEERRRSNELSYGTIGGHAITPGRALGQAVGFEVDSRPFTMVSGVTDLAVAVFADPFDIPAGIAADSLKAAKAFQRSGVIGSHVRGVDPGMVDSFIKSAPGRAVVDELTRAGPDDFADLWRKSNGQIPVAAMNDLLAAGTADEVTELLYNQLGVTIRTKGAARSVLPSVHPAAAAREGLQRRRLFNLMPAQRFDADDLDDTVRQLDRFLVNAKTPDDVRAGFINRAAQTRWREDRFLLTQEILHDTQIRVLGDGLSTTGRKKADEMFRMYADATGEARKFNTDALGNNIPGLQVADADGELIGAPGAQLMSELAQHVPLGDARDIRRATSKLEPFLNSPIRYPVSWAHFVQDRVWKPLVLARIAWPVRVISEEQIRMAAAGNRSMVFHPIQAISYMVNRDLGPLKARGATDVAGDVLAETAGYQRAMSQSRGGIIDDVIRKPTGGWTLARKQDRVFVEAWGDELAEIQADPIAREIARMRANVSKYADLDEIKAAYWDGDLSRHRELWATSRPGQRVRQAPPVEGAGPQSADEYIDSVAARVDTKTLGDDGLMTVAATGRMDGELLVDPVTGRISDTARRGLGRVEVDDSFRVKTRNYTDEDVAGWDKVVDWTMSHLMTRPTNYLSRSPSFRQFYWRRVEEIASATDPATRRALADAAENANLPDVAARIRRRQSSVPLDSTVVRIADVDPDGIHVALDPILEGDDPVNLTIAQIDEIAKGHALDDTNGLLYDLTDRSQFFDINRLLFPFGEAWMEVLTRWATLVKENPALVRRGQKALSQANEGFFYENGDGELVFNYPGSGWLTEQWTGMFGIGDTPGVPFSMTGRAHGLSVATEILPGAGPVVQMGADRIIPNRPKWDPLRKAIMPFGSSDSLTDLIIPPAVSKILAGLSGDDQASIFDFGESPEADRLFGNTVIDSMRHLESTGGYDISTDEGQRKLLDDATLVAQRMWFLRGVGQFVSPTSPSFEETIIANDGELLAIAALTEAYQGYRDEDPTTAYDRILEEFGDTILPGLVGKSTAIRPGAEALTEEGNDWLKNNERVERDFPRVWGYFAPQTGEFDYEGYLRSFESGARASITPDEWVREVNSLRGRLEYDVRRKAVAEKFPDGPPANVREWLSDERRQLKIDYPGYMENEGIEGTTSFPEGVRGIQAALEDDMLRGTEAGQAMVDYFGARDKVFAAMRERDEGHADSTDGELSQSLMSAGKWAYMRDWLWQHGEALVAESPDFGNVWDGLLVREVNKEQE